MNFAQWLESTDVPIFTFIKDGTVIVYLRNKRYVYTMDAGYHDRLKTQSRYAPWKVLNQVKELGDQIEPRPQAKQQAFKF
jgi:hypothetical protein